MDNTFLQILQALPEPALVISADGVILAANEPVAALAGTHREKLAGSPLASHLTDSADEVHRFICACAQSSLMLGGSFAWRGGVDNSRLHFEGVALNLVLSGAPGSVLLRCRTSTRAMPSDSKRSAEMDGASDWQNQEAAARLAAIVESSDDAIVSKDLNGIITSWNKSAQRLFGYTSEEIIGRSILTLLPTDRKAEEVEILARLRRGERVDHFETLRVTKDGRHIHVSLTISPVKDEHGKIIGISKIARDISLRKKAEEERERLLDSERAARHEAERANRIKDEFLATLSHELRTPLNAIMGWAHVLASGDVQKEELKQVAQTIERNARVQTQLVEDLLDMSRIISGKLRLNVERVDMVSIIEAAIETARPAADARQIRIQPVLDTGAPPVMGDAARLQQVIWNLLSNAVKFTPREGRIQVLLERVNSHLEITVTDTGCGISSDFLPYVFDRFRQADASTTRRYGGLGLGLAIVKHVLELHGGSVRVKSAGENRGATFIVNLPVTAMHPEAEEHGAPLSSPAHPTFNENIDLTGIHVLVVDDEPDALDLIKRLLENSCAQVTLAPSAQDAMKSLSAQLPHLLLSDIGMPGEDGYSLIRRIRALPRDQGGDLPAIALTAFARSEDRRRAMLAGFQLHLSKPVEAAELRAAVATLVGRTGRQKENGPKS